MALQYTTTDFLNSVRLRGAIPNTTNTNNVNNTTNLLALATEELQIKLLPLIMSVREEFYVAAPQLTTIQPGKSTYQVPYRAVGGILRDVHIVQGTAMYQLKPMESEYLTTTTSSDVLGYYWQNNSVVLYPTPGPAYTGTLRMRYFQRPSALALTTSCAQITAVNTGTNTITVAVIPASWAVGTQLDFVRASPPYDNQAIDQTITGISGTQITFASLPVDELGVSTIAVNDWVAPAEYTPIPQVPREFQAVLAQMTVCRVLQSQTDQAGFQQAMADLQILQNNALAMITQRNEGENHKVISRNWYRR